MPETHMRPGKESYQAAIARKFREGRGLGELTSYNPWLHIRDVSSLGRSHLALSATVGREHHLLSDLEELVFLYADYSPSVIDIREQFPLFPREETAAIAEELGIEHPSHYGVQDVLTEDLILTLRGAPQRLIARQVKYVKELESPETRQKLEIQKRYFERKGIEWKLVTERDLPVTVSNNLKWLRRGAIETFEDPDVHHFEEALKRAKGTEALGPWLRRTADDLAYPRDRAMLLFKRLVWAHVIELDITIPIELTTSLAALSLRLPSEESRYARSA